MGLCVRLYLCVASVIYFMTLSMSVQAAQSPKTVSCASRWNQMKAQGKTRGLDYLVYKVDCLKSATAPSVAKPKSVAVPAKLSAKPSFKPAPKRHSQQNRMKACGAKWQNMKAAGQAKNTTYRRFASACLKGKDDTT